MDREKSPTSLSESKKYCIYLHINKINGKKYIGQTCQKPKYRQNHGRGYIKNKDFQEDIKIYGQDKGFEHIIIEENLLEKDIDNREQYQIAYYDSYKNGYNQNEGGHCPHHYSQKAISHFKELSKNFQNSEKGKKTKEKVSASLKNFYQTPEGLALRKRFSEERTGKKHQFYGKNHSQEAKRKISESRKGELNPNQNKKGIKNHLSIPVYCIETNTFYGSGQEAKRLTGIDASSISKCCKGKVKRAGGKTQRYATEEEIIKLKGDN